eukprot:1424470-Pleurochrysis_carterae.AAC.1
MASFTSNFSITNSTILQLKAARFASFLKKAANGSLFQRPSTKPTCVAHLSHVPRANVRSAAELVRRCRIGIKYFA